MGLEVVGQAVGPEAVAFDIHSDLGLKQLAQSTVGYSG